MITVQTIEDIFHDEPPFLLFDEFNLIEEPASFLRQLLLKGICTSSLRSYAFDLLSFYRFMDAAKISTSNLSNKHALDYVAMLRKISAAPRTINRRITSIRSFLNFCKPNLGDNLFASQSSSFYKGQRNHALIGPTRIRRSGHALMKIKVPGTLKMPLQTDNVKLFISHLRSLRDKAIVALMLCLGLRSCEVINLQIYDIDFDASQIRVCGKGGKERLLPISGWIKSSLTNYLAFERPDMNHTSCFVVLKGKRLGQHMKPEGLRKIFRHRRIKNSFLKDAHPHSFRHTFCTNLIRQKVPLPVVQKLMGHASIDTTLIYTNLSLEDVSNEYHRAMDELAKADANEKNS
ncbi:MAG: tyrosine-type recombinase/integrase [Nanoarchaeota archaeon]|nr:tyrosine-type recombinase/integrase [Nanoarchaeota archaeon]